MAHLLVVYGTTDGQTRKIATFVANTLRERGHTVTLSDCDSITERVGEEVYDGIIVGASVHSGHHQQSVVRFVKQNRDRLQALPSAFFSVSLAAADGSEHQIAAQDYIARFRKETGWRPDVMEMVPGALRYTKYNLIKRFVMKWISRRSGRPTDTSRDYEFTDWEQVGRFVRRFLEHLEKKVLVGEPSREAQTEG